MKTKLSLIGSILSLALFAAACASQPVADRASLLEALREGGAAVESGGPVEQPFLSTAGEILLVNGEQVQVFEYGSAEAMEAEAALVSADGGSTGTTMIAWIAAPHFYKAGRILVLYVGEEQATLGLLESALGPQFAGR